MVSDVFAIQKDDRGRTDEFGDRTKSLMEDLLRTVEFLDRVTPLVVGRAKKR